ncbi:MAG TPA: BrnT family toxin [Saprospiraceae bacterium]|nr:BrnT family toxin [Saprospiraceae bacterium]
MEVQGFEWDDGNRKKCQSHGLSLEEIESVCFNQPRVLVNAKHISDEERFHAVGLTEDGRHVYIVFTFRKSTDGTLIRPISARFMHQKEIDHYEKQTKT